MANRSYLYSLTNQPKSYYDRPDSINELSEWAYDVPLAYKILMSGNPQRCASLISDGFEEEAEKTPLYAITADFDIGFQRLLKFKSIVEPLIYAEDDGMKEEINEGFNYLIESRLPYLLLETIELEIMCTNDRDELRDNVDKDIELIKLVGEAVDALPEDEEQAREILKVVAKTQQDNVFSVFYGIELNHKFDYAECLQTMGIGYWHDGLYYSLWNKEEFEKNSDELKG